MEGFLIDPHKADKGPTVYRGACLYRTCGSRGSAIASRLGGVGMSRDKVRVPLSYLPA